MATNLYLNLQSTHRHWAEIKKPGDLVKVCAYFQVKLHFAIQRQEPSRRIERRVACKQSPNSSLGHYQLSHSHEKSPCQSNKRALISLSDKRDLSFLGHGLLGLGYSIVSTGGTASALEEAGISVTKVEELTHFPEMLDGRVKSLHPHIHGGILARRDQQHHMEALNKHEIGTFDVVVVNLYPFCEKVSSINGIMFEEGIENIDIGGHVLIRAAAMNHKDVLVVVDFNDYPTLLECLQGKLDRQQFRRELAWKAFQHATSNDSAISEWFGKQSGKDMFPPSLTSSLSRTCSLRYGENPHQNAAFYVDKSLAEVNACGIATAKRQHGKEPSKRIERRVACKQAPNSSLGHYQLSHPHDESLRQSNKRALISLSDKRDLSFLGHGLLGLGYSIVSTGGTASALEEAGISVTKVEELTHFPEMLDGRVKTLHPHIFGGILARRDLQHHMEALNEHGIGTFDVVVVNLYPFYEKVSSINGIMFEEGIENIDIGGHALIRAAAKNHENVLVVVDYNDYPILLECLQEKLDGQQFRRELAWRAFQYAASYDSAISEWFWKQFGKDTFPPSLTLSLSRICSIRYGENPHQKAALYIDKSLSEVNACGIAAAKQHHGKEISYNNYLDADAAWNCVSEFKQPTCVIVKHTNPCGVASRADILEAYRLAVRGDPVSAFGGIIAVNVEINEALAREICEFRSPIDGETRMFYEIVVAPKYSERGLEILKGKSKTLRILEAKKSEKGKLSLRQVSGGWLAQDYDDIVPEDIKFSIVSEKIPGEGELHDAEFAWLCVKHVKSNAIVIAKNNCMLGMGSGQPNRLESLRIALRKAGEEVKEAALASDAFFPFAWKDAVEEACKSGIRVIAEPGGSIRDVDAIDCCNKYGVSLLFTKVRHFRH